MKTYLLVKKNVDLNGTIILRTGIYDADTAVSKYPLINFNNSEFFDHMYKNPQAPGTKVQYNHKKFYIIGTIEPTKSDYYGGSRLVAVARKGKEGSAVDPIYIIASSMTAREKDHIQVYESQLTIPAKYYFINSEGDICDGFEGENPRADEWRKKTGNYFTSKDLARIARTEMVKEHTNDEIYKNILE